MSKDIECPYCGHWQKVNHDDGQGYEEDVNHQMECEKCEKIFVFTTMVIYSYESEKADCLNDGNHDYKPTVTFPKEFTMMRCKMCGDVREPTESERIEYDLGSKEVFFKGLKNIELLF